VPAADINRLEVVTNNRRDERYSGSKHEQKTDK
jgi:hypothetical protein